MVNFHLESLIYIIQTHALTRSVQLFPQCWFQFCLSFRKRIELSCCAAKMYHAENLLYRLSWGCVRWRPLLKCEEIATDRFLICITGAVNVDCDTIPNFDTHTANIVQFNYTLILCNPYDPVLPADSFLPSLSFSFILSLVTALWHWMRQFSLFNEYKIRFHSNKWIYIKLWPFVLFECRNHMPLH